MKIAICASAMALCWWISVSALPVDRDKDAGFFLRGQAQGRLAAVHTASDIPISVCSSNQRVWRMFSGVSEKYRSVFQNHARGHRSVLTHPVIRRTRRFPRHQVSNPKWTRKTARAFTEEPSGSRGNALKR
jgi:hypothetical protein